MFHQQYHKLARADVQRHGAQEKKAEKHIALLTPNDFKSLLEGDHRRIEKQQRNRSLLVHI